MKFIFGTAGAIEYECRENEAADRDAIAIICHPHPLHGGTMDNKVITTLFKTFVKECRVVIRFNYRGVGDSDGAFGDSDGEIADCVSVLSWARNKYGNKGIFMCGFSFGAYIALRTSLLMDKLISLITVAPAVHHHDYFSLDEPKCPWLVVMGDRDELVPMREFDHWYAHRKGDTKLCKVVGGSHFFHGKLLEIQEIVKNFIDECDNRSIQ